MVARTPPDRGSPTPWDRSTLSLRHALPFAANTMLGIAYNRLDVVLVAILTTTNELAAYAPASRLQDALYILPTALSAVALPYLSRLLGPSSGLRASRKFVTNLWKAGLGVAIPVAAILVWSMPQVIETVLGPAYLSAVTPARILTLSIVVASVGAPVLALLIAAGRGADTTKAFAAAFAVSVSLHLALDWWLGALGAAIASLTRDVANLAVATWLARDLLRGPPVRPLDRAPSDRLDPVATSGDVRAL